MQAIEFKEKDLFHYNWCGTFQSPNSEWMHMTRILGDFELIVVTKGVLYIADKEGRYEVRRGEYLLMKPTSQQYGYQKSDCSFYWLHFSCKEPKTGYRVIDVKSGGDSYNGNGMVIPIQEALPAIDRIIVLMKQLQDSDRRYHDTYSNRIMTTGILCELHNQMFLLKKDVVKNSKEQLYRDIIDYIAWRIGEDVKVSDIAEYFGYNTKYLTTLFAKMAGQPIKKYMLQEKMAHAKRQLLDTNHTITQIAYNTGYQDVHNFSNSFKKVTGLAPSEYRNAYTKRQIFYE